MSTTRSLTLHFVFLFMLSVLVVMASTSPCAACKFLRRKCTQTCVFANYFPPDQPAKFANVHRVFGASNVAKLLNELPPAQREDAVNSLAYESEARLRDPVYGPVGHISVLQQRLKQVQSDLYSAKQELSTYVGPVAFANQSAAFANQSMFSLAAGQHHHLNPISAMAPPANGSVIQPFGIPGMMGTVSPNQMIIRDHQQIVEAQQLAVYQQQMRLYEQHHQQQQEELLRLNHGFDAGNFQFNQMAGGSSAANVSLAAGPPFNQLTGGSSATDLPPPPSELTLVPAQPLDNIFRIQQQQQQYQEHQLLHHPKTETDETNNGIGPS